jgi:hypothetical protein
MSKPKKRKRPIESTPSPKKPTQILLDESFILCASHQGCDSKAEYCQEESEEKQSSAVLAILSAYKAKTALVLDNAEPSQVASFYREKYDLMSIDVQKTLKQWLNGRGKARLNRYKPAKINSKAVKECNLKEDTLDPLLCQLAIASHGEAPVWTLDSDFWCANKFYTEIKPTCPKEAYDSVR